MGGVRGRDKEIYSAAPDGLALPQKRAPTLSGWRVSIVPTKSGRKECVGWVKYRRRELEEVQKEVERYLHYYHYQRPHLGLNMQTPLPLELSHLT